MEADLARLDAAARGRAPGSRARALASGQAGPTYLIGRNPEAARLASALKVAGLVDDGAAPGSTWRGLPVLGSDRLPPGAILVNTLTSIRPVDVLRRFPPGSEVEVIAVDEALSATGLDPPDFVIDQRADWSRRRVEWTHLLDRLADDESRQTFLDVLGFRLSADPAWMRTYDVRLEEQYFEPFLALDGEVFVDAGGYDGDTAEAFITRDPGYGAVHLFEPSATNMARARRRLAGLRDIHFHEVGLSDAHGRVFFDPDAGSASAVTTAGAQSIPVVRLDDVPTGPVSVIKMDLEGWETRALEGARDRIARDRPRLAIAVYHRASDFRDVSRFALALHPDYRVYLRHYTQGWSETVMFFV